LPASIISGKNRSINGTTDLTKFETVNTFANASKRIALTPGVLAILSPTAARMLHPLITSIWNEIVVSKEN
jgi:hypothetical protein